LSTITLAPGHAPAATQNRTRMVTTAFLNLLWRDLWVTLREWPAFLAQTFMQPLFFLFIFGKVLPKIGAAQGGYSILLLPGIITKVPLGPPTTTTLPRAWMLSWR